MSEVSLSSVGSLGSLIRAADKTDTVVEGVIHHAEWLLLAVHLRLVCVGCSMREQSLIDFQKSSLVVDEEVKNV